MLTTVKGLVVRESPSGDNDKILQVLTKEQGRLSVIAKGAKSIRNRYMNACQLFAYSTFHLYIGNGSSLCRLRDAELISSFYGLRSSLETLSLASYICDVAAQVSTSHNDEDEILSLTLNTLYVLEKGSCPLYQVKGVFELRLMSVAGFMPDLVACSICVASEGEMYFDTIEGELVCPDCLAKQGEARPFGEMIRLSDPVLRALRHVIYSQPNRIFAFTLTPDQHEGFSHACERFMLDQVGHGFSTLTFYKQTVSATNENKGIDSL